MDQFVTLFGQANVKLPEVEQELLIRFDAIAKTRSFLTFQDADSNDCFRLKNGNVIYITVT